MISLNLWLLGSYIREKIPYFEKMNYEDQFLAVKKIGEDFLKSKQRKEFVNDALAIEMYILTNSDEIAQLLEEEIWT